MTDEPVSPPSCPAPDSPGASPLPSARSSPREKSTPLAPTELRLGSPSAVVTTVPYLFGFHPTASLVVLGLTRGTSRHGARVQHGLRFGLGEVEEQASAFGRDLAYRLRAFGCDEAILVIYPPAGAIARPYDHRALLAAVRTQLHAAKVRIADAIYVACGRWFSLTCRNPACCPPDGVPLPEAARASETVVGALAAYAGVVVHADRASLAATLDPYQGAPAAAMCRALDAVAEARAAECGVPMAAGQRAGARRGVVETAHRLVDRLARDSVDGLPRLSDDEAATLLVAMLDVGVRDHFARWAADENAESLLTIATELARRAARPVYAPAPYTLVAWAAWALGRGTLARLALDRALAADPTYPLALLIDEGLSRGLPPASIRRAARETGRGAHDLSGRESRQRRAQS
jgi:hypothetical protein